MPLTCSVYDYDFDSWYFYPPENYTKFDGARRKRCSCGEMISTGDICTKFECYRPINTFIEECIYGEERPLASKYLCERCSDLYFSFQDLGFVAVCPTENMLELAKEYFEIYQRGEVG